MAYDPDIAERIRDALGAQPNVVEKKMFGGLGFLVDGHMAIAASSDKGALVRADPAHSDRLISTTAARAMVMRGKEMPGWLSVPASELSSQQDVARWVEVALGYVRSLPPKQA